MAEEVNAPVGREVVLTPEEVKIMRKNWGKKFVEQKDGTFKCRACGETILAVRVAHPIWDGPFPCSGSGRCWYELVPYCPKCDEKPGPHGLPIAPKGSYHNP